MKLFSSDIGHLTYHSKRLSYLLRHSKLPNHKGWIKVGVVQNELGVLLLDIQKIVYEDTKGRFEFSEDKSSVRALYGHSIDVNLGLEPTTPPPVLYHGTAEKYIDSIMKEGLRPRTWQSHCTIYRYGRNAKGWLQVLQSLKWYLVN